MLENINLLKNNDIVMKTISHLLYGTHPKTNKIKGRTVQIIKFLKENGGKLEAKDLEEKLGVSRINSPSMFYKPLAALKDWDLVQSHKKVEFDESGKRKFKTTYELTPELFFHHIQKTLLEKCKTELEMV